MPFLKIFLAASSRPALTSSLAQALNSLPSLTLDRCPPKGLLVHASASLFLSTLVLPMTPSPPMVALLPSSLAMAICARELPGLIRFAASMSSAALSTSR